MPHWREFLDPSAPAGRYLAWKEVARRTSLSRTTAWRLQRRDEFPRGYPISPGRVGHLECEIEAWISSRQADPERRPAAAATAETPHVAPPKPPGEAPPPPRAAASPPVRAGPTRPKARSSDRTAQIHFNF